MTKENDFKKEWEKAKKQIMQFSQEAAKLTKKGEEEIIKFSKISKLHIDSTALGIQKERLYYLIGKEYVSCKDAKKSAKLRKFVSEVHKLEKGQKSIQSKLKTKPEPKKKTPVRKKKTAKKKTAAK